MMSKLRMMWPPLSEAVFSSAEAGDEKSKPSSHPSCACSTTSACGHHPNLNDFE